MLSLPAWGEWIEINIALGIVFDLLCLSPHGESGLKLKGDIEMLKKCDVSPRMGRVD